MHRPMVVTIMAICTQQRPETDFPVRVGGMDSERRRWIPRVNVNTTDATTRYENDRFSSHSRI
jgi:hypothetical protein